MKTLIIATNNAGKAREIKSIFSGIFDEILSLKDAGIVADVVEDGTTFQENAEKKAKEISLLTDAFVLSDDSGLCVDGLNGAPGVFSARYSKEGTDASNRKALIQAVTPLSAQERTARFVSVVSLAKRGEILHSAIGTSDDGKIILEERGENGFGYDSIFYLEEKNKTYAEISAEEKNNMSHRGRALAHLHAWMVENFHA